MGQVTVVSGAQRRRRWSLDEKLALVEASMAPGVSIADVACASDVDVSLIYKWRRILVSVAPERSRSSPQFAEVAMRPEQPAAPVADKVIVIELPSAKVRIPPGASPELLKVVLRESLA
ncbi:IS66-like element accessory protein TnpA [Novosphingobium sp. YAF33]|uniref:IS66-like element accessory protein TnpA n=1 Tax=Novosphingobium sp. YAF33 TaxID=3233082 RepID=UPI003F9544E2